ncbi:Transcription factor BYE1 [Balamuthia mandrillaris]
MLGIFGKRKKEEESGGGGTTNARPVFGIPFADAAQLSEDGSIPVPVRKCVEYINEKGLEEEGIYRKSGSFGRIKDYRRAFDNGEEVNFSEEQDPSTVAGVLLLFFKELPEPIYTDSLLNSFLQLCRISERTLRFNALTSLLCQLPRCNRITLRYMAEHWRNVAMNAAANKMSPANIGVCFGSVSSAIVPVLIDAIGQPGAWPSEAELEAIVQQATTEEQWTHEEEDPPSSLAWEEGGEGYYGDERSGEEESEEAARPPLPPGRPTKDGSREAASVPPPLPQREPFSHSSSSTTTAAPQQPLLSPRRPPPPLPAGRPSSQPQSLPSIPPATVGRGAVAPPLPPSRGVGGRGVGVSQRGGERGGRGAGGNGGNRPLPSGQHPQQQQNRGRSHVMRTRYCTLQMEATHVTKKFFGSPGELRLRCFTTKLPFYKPGDTISVSVMLENETKQKVNDLAIFLETTKFVGPKRKAEKIRSQKTVFHKGLDFQVEKAAANSKEEDATNKPGLLVSCFQKEFVFQVPIDAPNSEEGVVQHSLIIELGLKLHRPLEAVLPLTISNNGSFPPRLEGAVKKEGGLLSLPPQLLPPLPSTAAGAGGGRRPSSFGGVHTSSSSPASPPPSVGPKMPFLSRSGSDNSLPLDGSNNDNVFLNNNGSNIVSNSPPLPRRPSTPPLPRRHSAASIDTSILAALNSSSSSSPPSPSPLGFAPSSFTKDTPPSLPPRAGHSLLPPSSPSSPSSAPPSLASSPLPPSAHPIAPRGAAHPQLTVTLGGIQPISVRGRSAAPIPAGTVRRASRPIADLTSMFDASSGC